MASQFGQTKVRRINSVAALGVLTLLCVACLGSVDPSSDEDLNARPTDGDGGGGGASWNGGTGGDASGGLSPAVGGMHAGAAGQAGLWGTGGKAEPTADSGVALDATPSVPYEAPPATGYAETLLFAGAPPNRKQNATPESKDNTGLYSNVSVPTIRRYPVNTAKLTGVALVVFPGGGYNVVDMDAHAKALAGRLGPLGIAVFGVKYRVGGGTDDARRDALLDAKRAVRVVRTNAAKWRLDPAKIGVAGYSAGSNLIMRLSGQFDLGQPNAADLIDRQSSRPDFVAGLCTWELGGNGQPTGVWPRSFQSTSPQTFMASANGDGTGLVALARDIERKLTTLKVDTAVVAYEGGNHDSFNVPPAATSDGNAPANWPEKKLLPWLQMRGLLPK